MDYKQKSNQFTQALKDYFDTHSEEEIHKYLDELSKYDEIGITVDEFINNNKYEILRIK